MVQRRQSDCADPGLLGTAPSVSGDENQAAWTRSRIGEAEVDRT